MRVRRNYFSGHMERSLESYLRDIGRYPLLRREEEVRLAERIREGDEEALHELVLANLRFVFTVAKQYLGHGLSLQDLINEGNIGLMKAGRRFDERRGFKFISYAVWWVRQAILQAISDQSRVVRLPQNRAVVLHKVKRMKAELTQRFGRIPSPEEIAEATQFSYSDVCEALRIGQRPAALDQIVSEEDGRTLADSLSDEDAEPTDASVLDRSCREDLGRLLADIPEREAKILVLYFGLDGSAALTLEEIGQRMSLTRERIRQLKERALGRLREHELSGILKIHHESAG
ncbi:MAG TPA: sigma-70 family RNA polymerase sigma factor [Candidatus Krumholzibacteria bacterium]